MAQTENLSRKSFFATGLSLFSIFVSCISQTSREFSIEKIEPNTAVLGETKPVTISGAFPMETHTSLAERPALRVDKEYSAGLVAADLSIHDLLEVTWLDNETLSATVSSDLNVGVYALIVDGPFGRAGPLEGAFTIYWTLEEGCRSDAADRQNGLGGSGAAVDSGLTGPVVLFQDDFTSFQENRGLGSPSGLGASHPYSLGGYVDPCNSDALWFFVVDRYNNRVLLFDEIPHAPNALPVVVLGQSNFASGAANAGGQTPNDVGFDQPVNVNVCSDGKLFVADRYNNRVMGWYRIPSISGEPADFVLGQTDFTANGFGTSSTQFHEPYSALCIDDKLFVADKLNNRVLMYDTIPHSSGAAADRVIGQKNLDENVAGCAADGLTEPYEVLLHNGRMYVADGGNNRVLEYSTVPTANGASANAVVGQSDFTSCAVDRGQAVPSEWTLDWPNSIAVDESSVLAVCDHFNNRIVFYDLPFVADQKARAQVGQVTFAEDDLVSPPTADSVGRCKGLLFDGDYLWVAEGPNHRVHAVALPSQLGD